jgi:hypothetical protein
MTHSEEAAQPDLRGTGLRTDTVEGAVVPVEQCFAVARRIKM